MRRLVPIALTIAAVLAGARAAAAQAPVTLRPAVLITEMQPRVPARTGITPLSVVDRLLSFDADSDHRIARDELPERMQDVVARGDRNADGHLDSDEIRALVSSPPPERRTVFFEAQRPGQLVDVVSDLRLPQPTHDWAMAIVKAYTHLRNVNDSTSPDLYEGMREVLEDEDYENFVAAVARMRKGPVIVRRVVGGLPAR